MDFGVLWLRSSSHPWEYSGRWGLGCRAKITKPSELRFRVLLADGGRDVRLERVTLCQGVF